MVATRHRQGSPDHDLERQHHRRYLPVPSWTPTARRSTSPPCTEQPESILKDQVTRISEGLSGPGCRPERLLTARPVGALRLHHRQRAPCSCPSAARTSSPPPRPWSRRSPCEKQDTDTCSLMAWGYQPLYHREEPLSRRVPGRGGVRLPSWSPPAQDSKRPISPSRNTSRSCGKDPARWGKPLAALLGAFRRPDGAGDRRHRR